MIKNWKLFKESVDIESKIREICKEYDIEEKVPGYINI
jgi:hypothetical protein